MQTTTTSIRNRPSVLSSLSEPKPSASVSGLNKRSLRSKPKESQFLVKHGHKHHAYDYEKAPYPVSFDRFVLELESLDNKLLKSTRGSMSFIDYDRGRPTPKKSLDLGCGVGIWVLEAARDWPDCEFVGFDLVNVQTPMYLLDPSLAKRITWVHGNFLTSKLPFEEDEFDHVHIHGVARGVPENKWGYLFEEVNRVLRPGGAVEICEEDVMFPILPKWFTSPLRSRAQLQSTIHLPSGTIRSTRSADSQPTLVDDEYESHDHALLESLYCSVFENRFINMTPTAVLPSYFQTYFRQVTLGPVLSFRMPPIPPPMPLPEQAASSELFADLLDPRGSMAFNSNTLVPPSARRASRSFSSAVSHTTSVDSSESLFSSDRKRKVSTSKSSMGESAGVEALKEEKKAPVCVAESLVKDSASVPMSSYVLKLQSMNERSLAMHLYYSYQSVLACQEAMWEELKDRILNKKHELKPYGWDDDEELGELKSRKKFELLLDRFKSHMHARVSMWCSLTEMGWSMPPRDSLNKSELLEEERMRRSVLEARKMVDETSQQPCRVIRILVGYKAAADATG